MNTIIDNNLSIEVIRTKRRKTASIKISNGSVQAYMPDELSDFKPVFKSETFNKKLKNRYDEIDTNNIFDQIVKSPGNN